MPSTVRLLMAALAVLSCLVAGCGDQDSPLAVTERLVAAYAAGDGPGVRELACQRYAEALAEECERITAEEGRMVFEVDYSLVSDDGSEAVVHLLGTATVYGPNGQAVEVEDMDRDVLLVREQGAWKFCQR